MLTLHEPATFGTDLLLAALGTWLALRVARMEEGGSLQQLYAESRATTLGEFRMALDQRALALNTLYADVAGSIFYLHGGAVPVRDSRFDWAAPVDGGTSASESP